eukprot:scaffold441084_cov33-Prasinocladus_malaysianus.AAC.1
MVRKTRTPSLNDLAVIRKACYHRYLEQIVARPETCKSRQARDSPPQSCQDAPDAFFAFVGE